MLVLYVVALGIGGTLLAASLLLGGEHGDHDHDVDFDTDVDADASADGDADHDVDAAGAIDVVMSFFPFLSLRFWTFFLAFFGLTGSTIELMSLQGPVIGGVVSGVIGYFAGMTIVMTMRRLKKSQSDSSVGETDYIGATGVAMLPIARGKTGKIRLELKGRSVELIADTEEDVRFEIKDAVMVYGLTEDGRAIVTKPEDAAA